MVRFFFKVILLIIPFLLLIGLFRVLVNGYESTSFLPSYSELLNIFSTFPDFTKDLKDEVSEIQKVGDEMSSYFDYAFNGEVNDMWEAFDAIGSFFVGIGKFFQAVGEGFKLVFMALSIPIQVIVWFFTNIIVVQEVEAPTYEGALSLYPTWANALECR